MGQVPIPTYLPAGNIAQALPPAINQRPVTNLTGRPDEAGFNQAPSNRAFPSTLSRPNLPYDGARYTLPPPAQLLAVAFPRNAQSIITHSTAANQSLLDRGILPPPTIQLRVGEMMLRYLVKDRVRVIGIERRVVMDSAKSL